MEGGDGKGSGEGIPVREEKHERSMVSWTSREKWFNEGADNCVESWEVKRDEHRSTMKGSGDCGKSCISGFMRICTSEGHLGDGVVTNPQISVA